MGEVIKCPYCYSVNCEYDYYDELEEEGFQCQDCDELFILEELDDA